jgi:hypothetical protein
MKHQALIVMTDEYRTTARCFVCRTVRAPRRNQRGKPDRSDREAYMQQPDVPGEGDDAFYINASGARYRKKQSRCSQCMIDGGCKKSFNRDVAAAINILMAGQALVRFGRRPDHLLRNQS